MTMLGESRSKGSVIILEGKGAGGWRGFSQELTGILTLAVPRLHHQRRQLPVLDGFVVQPNSNANGDSRSFKEAVILSNSIPNFSHASAGAQVDSCEFCNGYVNDSLGIFLKAILGCGLDNKWAEVMDKPSEDSVTIQNNDPTDPKPVSNSLNGPSSILKPHPPDPVLKSSPIIKPVTIVKSSLPKPTLKANLIWQPRSGSQIFPRGDVIASGSRDLEHVSVHNEDSESLHLESSLMLASQIPPIAKVFQGIGSVDKTWDPSSNCISISEMAGRCIYRWT